MKDQRKWPLNQGEDSTFLFLEKTFGAGFSLLNQKENRNKCFLTYHLKYVCRESTVFLVKTIFTQCRIATASLKIVKKL
jgi:hypothetical protein